MCQFSSATPYSTTDTADRSEAWTVNDILRKFGPAYLKKYGEHMSIDQIRALRATP